MEAAEAGIIPSGRAALIQAHVQHDSWCAIYKDKPCDCRPTISATITEPGREPYERAVAVDGKLVHSN